MLTPIHVWTGVLAVCAAAGNLLFKFFIFFFLIIYNNNNNNNSLPFEGVGVKFIRIFKTNNCQLVYYKDVLELFQVVE